MSRCVSVGKLFPGRLRRERRAAYAETAARVLPELLGRVQMADGARHGVEIEACEFFGDVGVVQRLLGDHV